jgi:hypothetical protein
MAPFVLTLLILAAPADSASEVRHPDAVEVFHCDFEAAWDADYDAWPDRWSRRRGPGFPRYLPIKVLAGDAPQGERALKPELNGGGAVALSPPIPVGHLFSYVLEGYVKTAGLKNNRAFFSVTFYDDQEKPLDSFESPRFAAADQWRKVSVSPLVPPNDRVKTAVIGLHLEPANAELRGDLTGAALFDDVWLARLPRMSLAINGPLNVFTAGEPVQVTCQVSGVFEGDPLLNFELVDISRGQKPGAQQRLDGEVVARQSSRASELLGEGVARTDGFVGTTTWKPPITEPGFYRIRATMEGRTGLILERQATLAVISPASPPREGEFGWSLPHGDRPVSLAALGELLPKMGINWVKLPVWVGEQQPGRLDQLAALAERLSQADIATVGLLTDPPPEVRSQFSQREALQAADLFTAKPEQWYPWLEPVMTQLSLQIRWWQLGHDGDVSFVGYPNLVRTIAGVRQQIQKFGQEVHLGMGWRMINEPLADSRPPWEFLSLSSDPPLTPAELSQYLPALDPKQARRWLVVEPLARSHYSTEVRAADLIHRMLAAKMQGAEGIFLAQPISTEKGLMNDDGTPGELLLPWRTTALALAGTKYLGSLQLPGGSENRLFSRDGRAVMIVWNTHSCEEKLYLGENLQQSTIWGKALSPPRDRGAHRIAVGPLPTFVTGIQEPFARVSMSVAFAEPKLPSIFGTPQENALVLRNYFGQGAGGQVRLIAPEGWKVYPRSFDLKLAAGEEAQLPFTTTLPFDASGGRRTVQVEIELTTDRQHALTVHRSLDIGLGDVTLDATTRLNDRGELEVEQQVVNHTTERVSFKCLLFVPDRRRMVSQVVKLGQDRDTKFYRLPNGRELVGKTLWLRAEEVGGKRILNHRFVVAE